MSWEEDYLIAKFRELEDRLGKHEARIGNLEGGQPQGESVQVAAGHATATAAAPALPGAADGEGEPADDGSVADSAADGSGDDDGPADYDACPIRVLREICRDRGLSPTGSKAELVTRLEENDAK